MAIPGGPDAVYLLDLSGYIFRAYHALPPLKAADGTPTHAAYGVARMLARLLHDLPGARIVAVCDAPGPSWRHVLYPGYKANRPPTPADLASQIPLIYDIVAALGLPLVSAAGHEADDLIAALARQLGAVAPLVIVSADKDLLQLVDDRVVMWDPMRDTVFDVPRVHDKWGVAPAQVADVLALMGDSSDDVPGVPGIGQKRAAELIRAYGSLEGTLANLDALPRQKWADSLRTHAADARLSARLVRLTEPLPGDVDVAALVRTAPDVASLQRLFARLDFHRLLDQLRPLLAGAGAEPRREPGGALVGAAVQILAAAPELDPYLAASPLSCDTETTDLQPRRAHLVGMSFAAGDGGGAYLPLRHDAGGNVDWTDVAPRLRTWAEDPRREKWGQNLKYDIQVLRAVGIELRGVGGDAMLASYLLDPDAGSHGLDALAERELKVRTIHFDEVAPAGRFAGVAVAAAARYAVEDALVAWRLCARLHERLRAEGLWGVYRDLELKLVPVLADMEWAGVRVDTAALDRFGAELSERLRTVESTVAALLGRPLNLQSPKQVGTLLFEELQLPTRGVRKLKSGGYSTDADVLEGLRNAHPLVPLVLEYRNLAKLQSTYVDALRAAVLPETGRIHPQFHQAVAATGRLSCANPNLQNIPIRDEGGARLRAAFVAAPGYQLVSADYNQIELRILAHVTEDPGLLAAFRGGEDVHRRTAADVYGISVDAVSPAQRRAAKAINFGLMYGMGPQALARQIGVSFDEARATIARYFERYPAILAWRDRTVAAARRDGYVTTLAGRRRFVPGLQSDDARLQSQGERLAINTPIQGTAADVIKRAMIDLHARLTREVPAARLILQVHDELVVEAPALAAETVRAMVATAMSQAAELRVPLKVDAAVGPTWAEAHG